MAIGMGATRYRDLNSDGPACIPKLSYTGWSRAYGCSGFAVSKEVKTKKRNKIDKILTTLHHIKFLQEEGSLNAARDTAA